MATDRTKKISEFTRISRAGPEDLLLLVNNPDGTPSTRTITIKNLYNDVGAEAIFYANTTHKANVAFQSNTLFTGNDNRFQSNVHFTSNLEVGSDVTINAFGRQYHGGNPMIGNTEFQLFVANTNQYIATIQANGTFLLPNGAFAVSNATFQSTLANTNSRLVGLESYGQLVANTHLIANYVSNTAFQSALANTNTKTANTSNRVDVLETKMANQESLTANGFNEAYANAIAYSHANMVLYTNEYYIPFGNTANPQYNNELDGVYLNYSLNRFNQHFWQTINDIPEAIERSANGQSVVFESGRMVGTPSPSIGFEVEANPGNTALRLSGGGVGTGDNPVIHAYKGFTYSFYPQWNDDNRNIIIVNTAGDATSQFSNGVITSNTGYNYQIADPANTVIITAKTVLTIPMEQESTLYYQDSANAQIYGEIRIR